MLPDIVCIPVQRPLVSSWYLGVAGSCLLREGKQPSFLVVLNDPVDVQPQYCTHCTQDNIVCCSCLEGTQSPSHCLCPLKLLVVPAYAGAELIVWGCITPVVLYRFIFFPRLNRIEDIPVLVN